MQVNVLSKMDLIESYGRLPLQLDYFTEVGLLPQCAYIGLLVK